MERVGVLVVSYGSREASMIDAFSRSKNYNVELYVADKQRNPYNVKMATKHVVIPDLDVKKICSFVERHSAKIDFGIVGPEKPIIQGFRDVVEKESDIKIICPTKKYAIEQSKVAQRLLFEKVEPKVNPRFKIFNPKNYINMRRVKKELHVWLNKLKNQAVVKPDNPAAGKGVGVWGDHFKTRKQLFEHFFSNFKYGSVIVEEKIDGEESSFQAFCDGKHLVPLPETRDYKRAFEGGKGPNTGGMGSYKDVKEFLPFMSKSDQEEEVRIVNKIFKELRGGEANPELLGVPFYVAFIHTGRGLKILENNSRPGDPEILNILPLLKDDFVDVCFKMLDTNLTRLELEKKASVAIYKVPPSYGGYMDVFPGKVLRREVGKPVDLNGAFKLSSEHGDRIRVYPAALELRDSTVYPLRSRGVCVVGIGNDIQTARELSMKGINKVSGGALWFRSDIASKKDVGRSVTHMEELKRQG